MSSKPTAPFRPPKYESPRQPGVRSYGPLVAWWIEANLVHGEGDAYGQRVQLQPFQRYILDRLYEFDPETGELVHQRAIIGIPKGNSKTELCAFIGLAELAGPIAPTSPNVAISAASWEQADKLYGAARVAATAGELRPFVDAFDTEILLKDRPGKIRRIAAVAGTNDGGLETCHIGDEVHEWAGEHRERVWTVMGNSLRKRTPRSDNPLLAMQRVGALQIGISTAGESKDGLLGLKYEEGRRVASGEIVAPGFLFMWWEASDHWDLSNPGQLREAILEANPAAGSFLATPNLMGRFVELLAEGKAHEFFRYHLNRWVSSPLSWLSNDVIDGRRRDPHRTAPPPPAGTSIVVGFDGSDNRDCTALIGWTLDDYGFVVEVWEPENGDPVPRASVDAAVHRAFDTWDVVEFAGDPPGWRSELEMWESEWGTRSFDEPHNRIIGSGRVLRFETFVYPRFGPACSQFKTAFLEGGPTIDGHPLLLRHLKNAQSYETRHGQVIVKDGKNSPRKIDAADAAIVARTRAMWHRANQGKATRTLPQAVGF